MEDNEIFVEAIYNFHIKLKTFIFNHVNGLDSLFLSYQRLGELMKGTESTITPETKVTVSQKATELLHKYSVVLLQ